MREASIASAFVRWVFAAGVAWGAACGKADCGGGTARSPPDSPATSGSTIYEGYRRFNGVCSHCHGADGVGSTFAPSLVDRPFAFNEFRDAVLNGRASGNFVMRGYADDPNVAPFIDSMYLYLKARNEGLGRGRPSAP
jgi:mono/diheme cytochrome c family protein